MIDILGYNSAVMNQQGRMFERTAQEGINSENFVRCFMNSEIGECFYTDGDPYQWLGFAYNIEKMNVIFHDEMYEEGEVFDSEAMYWVGWIYFYWHILTGETPKEIYRQANCEKMVNMYEGFHSFSERYVIQTIKEENGDYVEPEIFGPNNLINIP